MKAAHPGLDVDAGAGRNGPQHCQILALPCQILLLPAA